MDINIPPAVTSSDLESDLSCLPSFLHPKMGEEETLLFSVKMKCDFARETLNSAWNAVRAQ